jgi:hypothetical protein
MFFRHSNGSLGVNIPEGTLPLAGWPIGGLADFFWNVKQSAIVGIVG